MPPARRRPLLPSDSSRQDQTSRAPLPPDRRPFRLTPPTRPTTAANMITSPHNDKLKEIRRLNRRREARFVAEGEDLVAAADDAGWRAVYRLEAGGGAVAAADDAGWRAVYRLEAGVDVEPALLDEVSALGSGTRMLAVYERRWAPKAAGPLCVALWGVHDPGNVGTVLRSALAFGAASVALGPDCADPYTPKAIRASMGAIFAVDVAKVSAVHELPGERIALAAGAGEALAGPLDQPLTLVVGAERTEVGRGHV